jgi:hypothetical protein
MDCGFASRGGRSAAGGVGDSLRVPFGVPLPGFSQVTTAFRERCKKCDEPWPMSGSISQHSGWVGTSSAPGRQKTSCD